MAQVRIGTSGWRYDSWRGKFFPVGLRLDDQLQYYATQFSAVELNGVFYRTPMPDAVMRWRDQTGADFIFSWKASKYITHWKRLSEGSEDSLALLHDRVSCLGRKAGPLLFQLPPNFKADDERLARFLKLLRRRHRHVFEFRHQSWYRPSILRLLADHNVALCLSDHHDAPAPWERTADFVYIRGHGPGGRYKGHYSSAQLEEWARYIKAWKRRSIDVYTFFDNDQKAAAPADALKLQSLLKASRSTRPRSLRPARSSHAAALCS